jgi:hypothetical protein
MQLAKHINCTLIMSLNINGVPIAVKKWLYTIVLLESR